MVQAEALSGVRGAGAHDQTEAGLKTHTFELNDTYPTAQITQGNADLGRSERSASSIFGRQNVLYVKLDYQPHGAARAACALSCMDSAGDADGCFGTSCMGSC